MAGPLWLSFHPPPAACQLPEGPRVGVLSLHERFLSRTLA
jgi:hypothetical protein